MCMWTQTFTCKKSCHIFSFFDMIRDLNIKHTGKSSAKTGLFCKKDVAKETLQKNPVSVERDRCLWKETYISSTCSVAPKRGEGEHNPLDEQQHHREHCKNTRTHAHAHAHARAHTHTHAYTHTRKHTHTQTHTHTGILHTSMHTHPYTRTLTHTLA